MSDSVYIPACSTGPPHAVVKQYLRGEGPRHGPEEWALNWWDKNPAIYHDTVLFSAYYKNQLSHKARNLREGIMARDDVKIYADSGGFQYLTMKAIPDPVELIRWMDENVDYGFILDFPPMEMTTDDVKTAFVPAKDWRDRLKKTYEATKIMVNKRQRVPLYNVLHAEYPDMYEWYNTMKEFQLEGWAAGVQPFTPLKVALRTAFFISEGIRDRVHIFGVGGVSTIPVLAYSAKWIKNLTFDNSSFAAGAIKRDYFLPFLYGERLRFGSRQELKVGQVTTTKELPCECNICKYADGDRFRQPDYIAGLLLELHNVHVLVNYTKTMNMLVKNDEEAFLEMVKRRFGDKAWLSCMLVRTAAEEGFETSYRKWIERGTENVSSWF